MSLADKSVFATVTRLDRGGQQADLDKAISRDKQAVALQPPANFDQCLRLDDLADALQARFEQNGQQTDLDEAISLYRKALELVFGHHPGQFAHLNKLSRALHTRFRHGGQGSDLKEAISLASQALEHEPAPHPLRATSLNNLAFALWTHFNRAGGQQDDLEKSISLQRQALDLLPPPHPDRSVSLDHLAKGLWIRFEQQGQRSDLEEAISLHREALDLRPPPHPLRSNSLNNLAAVLSSRYEHVREQSDLDEAISLHKQALNLRAPPHPLRSSSLSNLAAVLSHLFSRDGRQSDIDEAILLHREALGLFPVHHPGRADTLINFSNALEQRFEQGGQRVDLDEMIAMIREALELQSSNQPRRLNSLNNLANALRKRFERDGQKTDLDEAILLHRQALELRGPLHSDRYMSLGNLGHALQDRFAKTAQQIDLDEAISLHRQALDLVPLGGGNRSLQLHYLATALRTRFLQRGPSSNLNDAISPLRQAPGLLRSPTQYNKSGASLTIPEALSVHGGQGSDLDESISLYRQALDELLSPSDPLRSGRLHELATALRIKFEETGQQTDLDEAIVLHREAVKLRPPPHPFRYESLDELGRDLILAHTHISNDLVFLDEAMSSFLSATECVSQPAFQRLHTASSWIRYATLHGHGSAIDAYDAALQALPQLAGLSFNIQSRQEALNTSSDGLARDASRFAIQAGNLGKAIEFLEAGRTVFWSQFLALRSPLEKLHDIAPELGSKLQNIATALEFGSHRDTSANMTDNPKKLILDLETSRLNRLNEDWLEAVDAVRHLDGFQDFLRPRRLLSLQAAASDGPVVILLAHDVDSHALIMTSTNIHHISLPNLPTQELQKIVHLIQAAASKSKIWRSSVEDISGNPGHFSEAVLESLRNWMDLEESRGVQRCGAELDSDDIFRSVLRRLWDEVVKPVIDILNLEKSEKLPLLRWCPTGLFSFLPIHAAGCYDNNETIDSECAFDYFISSYTPTIEALLARSQTPSTVPFKMMVVIQSRGLSSTQQELEAIERRVSNDLLFKLGVPGSTASVEAVASRLSAGTIVHFACHGKQNRFKPLDSGLKLEDEVLKVSRIMKENIQNGSLAFLCACETAMGDKNLPDEAMSLAASLLFCGFRRVIATMWEMRDEDGPVIADIFYEELFRGPEGKPAQEPDVSKSAYALHIAVNNLRSKHVSFRRWIPFIHMGN